MFGLVRYSTGKGAAPLGEEAVCGVRFRTAALPGPGRGLLRRLAVERTARLLERQGITRAVLPEPFPDREVFLKHGIGPVETLPLYRALAAELAQAALRAQGLSGDAVVAVCAKQLTPEVRRTVTELCIRNRYVILNAPDRNGEFSRQLRREYGAPVVLSGDPAQLGRAAVAVCFCPYAPASAEQVVIDLSGEGAPAFRLALEGREEELPEGVPTGQFLAALWTAGAVRPSQIAVSYFFL